MDYLIQIIIGVVEILLALLIIKFLPSYFSEKGKNLATKEDIAKITEEIEAVKVEYKKHYDLSTAERKFYDDMVQVIESFLVKIKRYEIETGEGKNSLTKEKIMKNIEIKKKYLTFIDSANVILAKAFVFLDEENYTLLKNAIDKQKDFAHIRTNLLDAMRKSIQVDTKLKAEVDSRNLNYE